MSEIKKLMKLEKKLMKIHRKLQKIKTRLTTDEASYDLDSASPEWEFTLSQPPGTPLDLESLLSDAARMKPGQVYFTVSGGRGSRG